MAEVETIERPETAETPAQHGGRRPGAGAKSKRDPDGVLKAAEAGVVRAPVDTEMEFFSYLKTFPASDWSEQLNLYLFRTAPITDRTKTGNFKYVQKYFTPIDQGQIMKDFGSGGYKLMFNRYDPGSRSTKLLREHNFDIQNIDFPPKVPLGEWIEDERNKEWQWARPALMAQQTTAYAMGGAGMQPADQAGMVKAIAEIIQVIRPESDDSERESLTTTVIQLLKDDRDAARKASDPAGLAGIITAIVAAVKPAPAGDNKILELLMQQNTALLTKIVDAKPAGDGLDQIDKVLTIVDRLRGRGRSAPAEAGTTGWDVARDLGGKVLDVASTIGQAYILRLGLMPPGARQPAPPPPPPADGTVTVHEAEEVQMTPEEQSKMVDQIATQYGPFFDEVTPHLVDQFHKFDGLEFRDWFCEEYGKSMYRTLTTFSQQTILEVIERRKQIAPDQIRARLAELQPRERLATFIEEFYSDEQLDDDEPDAPATTAARGEF